MTVTTHTTWFDNRLTSERWRELLANSQTATPFQQPTYLAAWWEHLGQGELQLVAIWEEDQLLGIAPLSRQDDHWQLIGGPEESDYLDFIVSASRATEVYAALATFLKSQNWSQIELYSLPADSPTRSWLTQLSLDREWLISAEKQLTCPVITLPTDVATYWQSIEPKVAKSYRQAQKNSGIDDEISYEVLTTSDAVATAMPDFIRLHRASSPEKAGFWVGGREAFFGTAIPALAEANLVKLFFLKVNGDRAAALLIFDWHSQYLLYNSGFDAGRYGYLRVGSVLLAHTLETAITEGKTRYDFMRGDEAYKLELGAKPEPVFNLTLTRPSAA